MTAVLIGVISLSGIFMLDLAAKQKKKKEGREQKCTSLTQVFYLYGYNYFYTILCVYVNSM